MKRKMTRIQLKRSRRIQRKPKKRLKKLTPLMSNRRPKMARKMPQMFLIQRKKATIQRQTMRKLMTKALPTRMMRLTAKKL